MAPGDFGHAVDDHIVLGFGGVVLGMRHLILEPSLGGFGTGQTGQSAGGERAVRGHGDVVFPAQAGQFALVFAGDEVVMALDGHKLRPAVGFGERVHLGELVGVAVRNADGARLAGLDRLIHAFHDFGHVGVVVPHVADVEVHIVEAEVPEACVEIRGHVPLTGHAGFPFGIRARQKLGGDLVFVTIAGNRTQRSAHVFLAGAVRVSDGRVVECDAMLEAVCDDLARLVGVENP